MGPEPTPKKEMKKAVKYTLHDEDDEDEELGPADPTKAFREAVKKQAKLDALKAEKEEKTKKHLTKEEKEAKEMEDAIAESKKDTAANATPEPKKDVSKELPKTEAPPKAPTASDLPPELAGELEAAPAEKKSRFRTGETLRSRERLRL